MQRSAEQGKPANPGADPLAGLPPEGQFTPAIERPALTGVEGRELRRSPQGPRACATAQELYLAFQQIRLEAEALRDALAAKRP